MNAIAEKITQPIKAPESDDGVRLIEGRPAIRCPNPDCDSENGCCMCEHTGWVDARGEIWRSEPHN